MKPKQQEGTRKATCRPTQGHWHQMNRKQRRETMRRIQRENLSLEVVHPDAAGIDIGNEFHYVAVPPTRDGGTGTSVRVHHNRVEVDGRLAEAMPDSNRRDAVDWRVLDRGIRHPRGGWFRSVPGECAGNEESTRAQKRRILRNSFRPPPEIRTMRTYWRRPNAVVPGAARPGPRD